VAAVHPEHESRWPGTVTGGPLVGPLTGFVAGLALLTILSRTVGLTLLGWTTGGVGEAATFGLLAGALVRSGRTRLNPADRVTAIRAALVSGIAALVAAPFAAAAAVPVVVPAVVGLATVALALDAVDGWTARRTGTASAFGARFDMEVDAFLILVLSVHVASVVGVWVLMIGAARYLYVAAGWGLPWLRAPVRPRYWRKVVAACQGVVLTVVSADLLGASLARMLLVVSLGLLAESFGRDVVELRAAHGRTRHRSPRRGGGPDVQPSSR
jgi:phosphatidylglycerophosphate synthase